MDEFQKRNTFLKLVRDQLELPHLSFEEALLQPLGKTLYKMVGRSLESSGPPPPPAPLPDQPPNLPALTQSRAVVQAAIEDTFDFEMLKPGEPERAALLASADVVIIKGDRRLRLKDDARAQVLSAVRGNPLYEEILSAAVKRDSDDHAAIGQDAVRLPSAWLRCLLTGRFKDLDAAPPKELAAALTARERLRLVAELPKDVPSISDLERRVALADLLEPLRLLIGSSGGWDGTPRTDRFVGREAELSVLRSFVNELSSQSIREFLQRFASEAVDVVLTNEKPNLRVLEADGGLGKSALLAKFVLDHALRQERPFPFAYLDFDRAALNPEQPHQLLIEIARQVGLQFPASQSAFQELAEDIRQTRAATSASKRSANISDPYARFVEILRQYATFGDRAFLLIFDTLEVVQWNPEAIGRLGDMLREFRAKKLVELRVVASGRADVPSLRIAAGVHSDSENIRLKALSVDEATQMATLLGAGAIGPLWKESWSKAIAGAGGWFESVKRVISTNEGVRREPLTIRVAVDLVLSEPAQRDKIAKEIEALRDEDGMPPLVARLYEKRVLNHVLDRNARKLAWPGLVLRRVTLEIARDLLAPICDLRPDEVGEAFIELEREVWMVIREGEALKHLPTLRARTLPLMRANDPDKFLRTTRAAVDYFGARGTLSNDNLAEWIYHRLQLGASVQDLISYLTPDLLQKLAGADEDFPVDSEAASYLVSRTATSRLPDPRVFKMRANDAVYHLSRTSPTVFGLDDVSVDRVALDLSKRLESPPGELVPWARALSITTGRWPIFNLEQNSLAKVPGSIQWMHLYWAVRVSPMWARSLPKSPFALLGFTLQAGSISLLDTVQALATTRLGEHREFKDIDRLTANILLQMNPNPLPSFQAALRTAIILGDTCRAPALELWLQSRRRGTHERVQKPTISGSELREMASFHPDAVSLIEGLESPSAGPASRFRDDDTVSTAARLLEQFLGSGLSGSDGTKVARVFAARDEDWIVPFGYAAELATNGNYPPVLGERLSSYSELAKRAVRLTHTIAPNWTDMVQAMRISDEAGDLAGFARLVLECVDIKSVEAQPLAALIQYRDRWKEEIAKFLAHGEGDVNVASGPAFLSEDPPEPGPISHKDDPQRSRWGGKSERDGRIVRGVLESVESNVFYFTIVVESSDGSPLLGPVVFHLHDTFPRSKVSIKRIVEGRRAELKEWSAYGIFAVGVQVKDAKGTWTQLEFDLAKLAGLPARFLKR
jgi:hypothetical protein